MKISNSLVVMLAASSTACASLPTSAPTTKEFSQSSPTAATFQKTYPIGPQYQIINLGPKISSAITKYYRNQSSAVVGDSHYSPTQVFLPGDTVAISIFDVSSQPLLGASTTESVTASAVSPVVGHSTALPTETIELNGDVKIPFAGRVDIAGLTPSQAARAIEVSLTGQLKAPQAIVSLVNSPLDAVTVGGDVARPGIVSLSVRGEHILDVIAAAGGAKYEAYDCDIDLVRHGSTSRMWLQDLVDQADHNVPVEPGDRLYISHNPRSFSVLGSAMKVSQIDFDSRSVTLAEAIARAGGANNSLTNLEYVFLLRYEPKDLVSAVDPEVHMSPEFSANYDGKIPVAYRINLRDGSGYFVAQNVEIHDKDIILMTKSNFSQLQQLFEIIHSVTGVYFDIKGAAFNGSY